jgi:hypothetical protein
LGKVRLRFKSEKRVWFEIIFKAIEIENASDVRGRFCFVYFSFPKELILRVSTFGIIIKMKVKKIIELKPYYLIFEFENGEIKKLVVDQFLNGQDSFSVERILNPSHFIKAQIGSLGQLYWPEAAHMKDINGDMILCEYDMSPEFIYNNSVPYILNHS